jgi:excisionase family DNA binding protein
MAESKLLTYVEMSNRINVKKNTLAQWVMQKRIPHIKIGRLVRFDENEVIKWFDSHKVKPAA